MNNFFVTIDGETIADNLTQRQAVKMGYDKLSKNSSLGTLSIGIGKTIWKGGKKFYTLLPLHFFEL